MRTNMLNYTLSSTAPSINPLDVEKEPTPEESLRLLQREIEDFKKEVYEEKIEHKEPKKL